VNAEAAAGPAGAFRIVEHEVLGLDVPIDKVVRRTAEPLVEPLALPLVRAVHDLRLEQSITEEQGRGDRGLDRLLVLSADDQPVHHRVHVSDV